MNVPHVSLVTSNYLSVPPAGTQETPPSTNLKRSGSERLRDGAKNILRRVESIKSRRKKKKKHCEGVIISGPVHLDIMQLHEKFQNMSTKDIKTCRSSTTSPLTGSPVNTSPAPLFLFADPKVCPTSDAHSATIFGHHLTPHRQGHPASRTSPLHFFTPKVNSTKAAAMTTSINTSATSTNAAATHSQRKHATADDSSSLCSEVSLDSSNESAEKKLSPVGRHHFHNNSNKKQEEDVGALSDTEAFHVREKKKRTTKSQKAGTIIRGGGGSLNLGRDSNRYRESLKTRRIFRSRSAVRHDNDSTAAQDVTLRAAASKNSSVVRWHSFRATTNTKRDFNDGEGVSLCKLSCGQIEKLRKLALVTLTGYMERYVHV